MSATVESTWKSKISNAVEIPNLTRCCFCVPLRRGLIAFAYINLILTLLTIVMISFRIDSPNPYYASEFPRLVIDITALITESLMTVAFIVGLHLKNLILMKIYMYFELVYAVICLVYGLAMLNWESATELFLLLFQLMVQVYLALMVWSSIVKIKRDASVKYTREI